MYSGYGELLSLASIDSAVDKLFKAYLDVMLVGFATSSPPAVSLAAWRLPNDYWSKVSEFRRTNLDPFTVPRTESGLVQGQRVLLEAARSAAQQRLESPQEGEHLKHARDYLYWFDIRAHFWSKTPLDGALRTLIVSADDLLKLQKAAQELQKREQMVVQYEKSLAKMPAAGTFMADPSARNKALLGCIVGEPHSKGLRDGAARDGAARGGAARGGAARGDGTASRGPTQPSPEKEAEVLTTPLPEPTETP